MEPLVIEPEEFNQKLQNGEITANQVIDVRELGEWDYYHLDHTRHIPMNTIPQRWSDFDEAEILYVICAHGVRSAAVCNYLAQQHDFTRVINVEGGMAAIAELRGFQYD